jgi:hypothetical protein
MSIKKLCRKSLAYFATFNCGSAVVEKSIYISKIVGSNPGKRSGEKGFVTLPLILTKTRSLNIKEKKLQERDRERDRERERAREEKAGRINRICSNICFGAKRVRKEKQKQ